jgi:hypothetical protein
VIFDTLVAGEACFEHRLVGRFAVVKMSPTARRGVFFLVRQKKSWVDSGSGSLPSE